MKNFGIFIILLGLGLLIFTTFTSFVKEKSAGIGKTEIVRDLPQEFDWYPLVGIGVMGVGAIVLRKSS